MLVTCCNERTAECLACEQRQEIWEYCRFHPWLHLDGCEGNIYCGSWLLVMLYNILESTKHLRIYLSLVFISLEFYENCGTVQCWKNEECCKMKCNANGTMVPDNLCIPTSPENPGCPLFVCEPPKTTERLPLENEEHETSIDENPFLARFLKTFNLFRNIN